jgi:hypothetical protein
MQFNWVTEPTTKLEVEQRQSSTPTSTRDCA